MSTWYARPVLFVADIARSLEFYTAKLEFKESWHYKDEGLYLVAQVERAGCELILSSQWPAKNGTGMIFISLDQGVIDALRSELERKCVEVKEGRWGYRVMIVEDPDGNALYFPYPAEAS